MFTVEWNKAVWEQHYHWCRGGDEWSCAWGGVEMEWHRTILPRIHAFVPAATVLEIAPGFGRWTQKLKDLCRRLHVVDLSAKCIETCRRRFQGCPHVNCHVNDGQSLPMIEDGSIDFTFTFDSLVHVNRGVLCSYLHELGRVLSPDGIAFLHHSNLGAYARRSALVERLPFSGLLKRWGLVEGNRHFRAPDVTAELVEQDAAAAGLQCVSQELLTWGSRRLIDCFTVLTRRGSHWARPNRVFRNRRFRAEIREAARLSQCYAVAAP